MIRMFMLTHDSKTEFFVVFVMSSRSSDSDSSSNFTTKSKPALNEEKY